MPVREYEDDTIAAIATPPGEGGIGIVRLSGPRALEIASRIFRASAGGAAFADRRVSYGRIEDDGRMIDEALLLVMRGPKSFTGQDVAELQTHGSPAVLKTILSLCVREGARPAAPGEFTKRAFLNGRIDLVQAEAVLDLIQARSEKSARWAAGQLEGHLSRRLGSLKQTLLNALAHLEAAVDFPEDHPETDALPEIEGQLAATEKELRDLLKGAESAILAKRGARVVLWGRPNVGKSSLMNALARCDRVIVTPVPGTTRDVVEEETLIEGIPIRLVDTAGIQDSRDPIEKEGIDRSRKAMTSADLVLFVMDASQPSTKDDKRLAKEIANKPVIVVWNKADLSGKAAVGEALVAAPTILSSCVGKPGIEPLRKAILDHVLAGQTELSDEPAVSSVRQKEHLEKALEHLVSARKACAQGLSYEFIASDVRLALDRLGGLVGEIVTDDMLEILFSRFCIGK